MTEFLNTVYGQVTAVAAGVAMLWGLFKGIGAFIRWCEKVKKDRLELPQKTLTLLEEYQREQEKTNEEILKKLDEISTDLYNNG